MTLLSLGARGNEVRRWQTFLIGQKLSLGNADGIFGAKTKSATTRFQIMQALPSKTGDVDDTTIKRAVLLGYNSTDKTGAVQEERHQGDPAYPPLPTFRLPAGNAGRFAMFGEFEYAAQPIPSNKENIVIHGDWRKNNIITIEIPELIGVKGSGRVQFHRRGADQMKALWSEWQKSGLLDRVLTWGGSFMPRYVRGSTKTLSTHAFGGAFDINMSQNPLYKMPPLVGERGSVRELVESANKYGFYWGGHFNNRKDGMHFEIAKIL